MSLRIVNKKLRGGNSACRNICNAQIWGIRGYINKCFQTQTLSLIHIYRETVQVPLMTEALLFTHGLFFHLA